MKGAEYQIYSLNIDNKRLKQENQQSQETIEELQNDLQYLQQSIESHLPVITELEVKNQELEGQVTNQNKSIRQVQVVQNKLRALEQKQSESEQKHSNEIGKLNSDVKSLKERLDTVKAMNVNLQKVNQKYKKKAESYDYVEKKCSELHKANQRLVQILGNVDALQSMKMGLDQDVLSGPTIPLEELKTYHEIIQKYNLDDELSSDMRQVQKQFHAQTLNRARGNSASQNSNLNTLNALNQVMANKAMNASKMQGYNIENQDLINKAPGGSGRGLGTNKIVNAT